MEKQCCSRGGARWQQMGCGACGIPLPQPGDALWLTVPPPCPLLLPVDRKSGGVGDLKYPLVADLKKEIRCGAQRGWHCTNSRADP